MGLIAVIIDYFAVARGGIEPPTHGFSVRFKLLLLNLHLKSDYNGKSQQSTID